MTITVRLHTILQRQLPKGQERELALELPAGATIRDALERLNITLDPDALLLVIRHRVVDLEVVLADGDQLDIIPAISGG